MSIFSKLWKPVLGIVNLGTADFDEKTARKIQIINLVSLVFVVCIASVAIVIYQLDDWGWKKAAELNLLLLLGLIPVFVMHKVGYGAKVGYFILWFVVFITFAVTFGLRNGTYFLLLAAPVVLFYFLGSSNIVLTAILTTLASTTFLLFYFTVPESIGFDEALYDAVRIPFIDEFDITENDIIFIVNIMGLEFILFLTTYIAFSTIEKSEAALEREYARSELLLQNLLPKPIAARLKDHPNKVIADEFDDVSILFADIEGFTARASNQSAEQIVGMLNRVFSEFDKLAEKYGLEKIKTIGDAYMVAGGMPERRNGHASALAEMALEMISVVEKLTEDLGEHISVRIGIHSGPAVAGVIGKNKPFYDVWGDTINIASRMESSGSAGRIQITPELKEMLGANYRFEKRGTIDIKGKGKMSPYYLVGRS